MTDFLGPKSSKKYFCKVCDYSTSKKSQYDRHLLTSKHLKKTNTDPILTNLGPKSSTGEFICECGKNYKHKQSLYNHKKKCIFIKKEETSITDYDVKNMSYKDMFLTVVK